MKKIYVNLSPDWNGTTIATMAVEIRAELTAKQGAYLICINDRTTIKTFCPLSEPFTLSDAAGIIACEQTTEDMVQIILHQYLAPRDVDGEVTISYVLKPESAGRNPVFDLGSEPGGLTGSGMCFLPMFPEGQYEYHIHWDLTKLPEGAVGAWSFGAGDSVHTGNEQLLEMTFWGVGMMDCVRLGNFSYYWYKNDTILDTAIVTAKIFRYEAAFFGDSGEPYTIFARRVDLPEPRAGGTALTRAYSYLYASDEQLNPTWLKFLFAHEMVHNWIHMDDIPFGTCTWYVEGMAEFYSSVLPFRMGIVSHEELVGELNKRAKQYFENPSIGVTNAEAGKGLFSDPERTRVPYGRGFFYLTHADRMIRQATHGSKCLDDVMLELNRRFAENSKLQNEAWLEVYGSYVGAETARAEFEAMSMGGEIIPAADCWGGEVALEKTEGSVRGSQQKCVLWKFA